jgi:PIN domain nuclease of toxin-antitoxin system
MRLIVDTQALIWFVEGNKLLPLHIRMIIEDPANQVDVSIASIWEIGIKISIGKLILSKSLSELITQLKTDHIGILPIEPNHIIDLLALPAFHKDPFDRIIITQAMAAQSKLVTSDTIIHQYPVDILW